MQVAMMDHKDNDRSLSLTAVNHLERDHRLNGWTVHGLGGGSHQTEDWVDMILSLDLPIDAPEDLREIFERARAVIVYGCYHYPLFTLGVEELLRYNESLLRFALGKDGFDKNGQALRFAGLIDKAASKGLIATHDRQSWHSGRKARNSTTHKKKSILLGPNDALNALEIARKRTIALISSIA